MTDQYKAILEELCRSAFNIPVGELTELFSKSGADITDDDRTGLTDKLKAKYRDIVGSINKTNNLKLDEKFKAGQRNKAEEFEDSLRTTFNVDAEKKMTGADLVAEALNQVTEAAKKKGNLTEDEIKKTPVYLKLEQDLKKDLQKLKDEHKTTMDGLEAKQKSKELFERVSGKAMEIFDTMKPVLSEDPVKAKAQRQLVVNALQQYEYQETDDKTFVPVKDGKRVEDDMHHAIDLEKLVKDITTPIFDFNMAEKRESPNGDKKPGDPGYVPLKNEGGKDSYKGAMPKTEDDWQKLMNDPALSVDHKLQINEHWEKNQPKK